MDLKQTAKFKGMGGFLQVGALMDKFPDLREFFCIVTGTKPAPPTVENASLILILDETPLDGINEVALNQTNTKRCIQFLEREFGNTDSDLLRDCVVHFRIREYAEYKRLNLSRYGIEIAMIEPSPDCPEARAMEFRTSAPEQPREIDPAANPYKSRREEIEARLRLEREKAETASESKAKAPAKTAAKTAAKKRK